MKLGAMTLMAAMIVAQALAQQAAPPGPAAAPAMAAVQAPPAPPKAPAPPGQPEKMAFFMSAGSGSFLGVGVTEIDSARARDLKLREERGVEITSVASDSPAEKAGLKAGDVVLDYNGEAVQGTEQFVRLVRETPVGREVKMTVWRSGGSMVLTATIGKRAARGKEVEVMGRRIEWPQVWAPDIPRVSTMWKSSMLGVEAEALEGQLAQHFGVTQGVLVRSVAGGSAAARAGLKAGDVITKIDGKDVRTPRELSQEIRSQTGARTATLTVYRERKETQVSVKFEDERGGDRDRERARSVVRRQE
jgi:serine protease Do